jgi:V-type H+-transporting ATPase subunit H
MYLVYYVIRLSLYVFVLTAISYYLCIQDLLDALNQLEVGLKENLKKLSSFDKYKQQVLLGHLDWSPMHKDPSFWRENINNFEENDFQVCLVLS